MCLANFVMGGGKVSLNPFSELKNGIKMGAATAKAATKYGHQLAVYATKNGPTGRLLGLNDTSQPKAPTSMPYDDPLAQRRQRLATLQAGTSGSFGTLLGSGG
jgi:hypothetical protein